MQRPSFQFYPADWLGNSNLRRCTHAEKGTWLEIMCLMHDAPEYGVLRWPLSEMAQAIGGAVDTLRGLIAKGVMKGSDDAECDSYEFVPRHAGKDGEPVTLVAASPGPIWYSTRMVRDEYKRQVRGASSRFGADGDGTKADPKTTPMPAPIPPFGDGASSSSSSSTKRKAASPPQVPSNPKETIFTLGVQILTGQGEKESQARAFLGKFAGQDEEKLAGIIGHLAANPKVQAKGYIAGAFKPEERGLVL
jgi:hypothetical protein